MEKRATLGLALSLSIGLAPFPSSAADADPPRAVRLVVPANGSGIPLVIALMLAKKNTQAHDLTLLVDFNDTQSPEAVIERFASAKADGKTLLLLSREMQMSLGGEGRNVVNGMAPIIELAAMPYLIVTQFGAPAQTLSDLLVLGQKRTGEVSYGSADADHLARTVGEMLNKTTRLSMRHVAFGSTSMTLAGVMRRNVSVAVERAPAVLPYIRARKLVGLATTSKGRLPAAPLIPALSETFPDVELVNWIGLFAPCGTPRSAIDTVNHALSQVLRSAEVHVRLTHMGLISVGTNPSRFAAELKSDPQAANSQARACLGTR